MKTEEVLERLRVPCKHAERGDEDYHHCWACALAILNGFAAAVREECAQIAYAHDCTGEDYCVCWQAVARAIRKGKP